MISGYLTVAMPPKQANGHQDVKRKSSVMCLDREGYIAYAKNAAGLTANDASAKWATDESKRIVNEKVCAVVEVEPGITVSEGMVQND